MNSQIFPGLSESFLRQEYGRMLEEAEMSRLLQQVKTVQSPLDVFFSLDVNIARNPPLTKTSSFKNKMIRIRSRYEHAK